VNDTATIRIGGGAALRRVAACQLRDVVRSRWLIAYSLFFLVLTEALLRFGGGGSRVLLSLVDIVLFVVPLVTVVLGTTYLYNAREFVELILAQPVRRRAVFGGLYLGLVVPLVMGFVGGVGIPFAVHGDAADVPALLAVLGVGALLTLVFGAIALLIAVRSDDRLRGVGIAIGVWLLTAVVYDGVVLLLAATFADYPLERPMLGAMMANPVDLARVVLLLRFDVAALLGYTGAVFQQFFGGVKGTAIAVAALLVWVAVPLALAGRAFARKDF
jgi:Cu-processing system permease protein